MASDFIERLQRVSLTAEEDKVIMVWPKHRKKTLGEWSLSLLGMFHTTKLINLRAAKNHLLSAWKMGGNDVKITDVGNGLFRFKFLMESQLKWVINNGPWSFDNHILLLRRWEKGMTFFSVNLQTVPMWVQVWGLPFDLINKEAGIDIGQGIGRVIEVDWKAIASDQARFLRVRVDVPLDKTIRREAPVPSPEGEKVWVAFKYERLCGLCFHCGLLGHEEKACKTTKLKVGEESPYGEWLRATEDGNPNGYGIDGAQTEPQQNFNSGNGHSYHSTTVIEPSFFPREGSRIYAKSIQYYMKSSSGTELKWLQQKLDCFDPKLLQSQGIRWLCDAFRLLLTHPTVKRLVVSLASDKSVWDVILRNTSVREFQWTPYAVNYIRPLISNEEPGLATRILRWIWDGTEAEFGKYLSLVNELFQPPKSKNPTKGNKKQTEEKIRSSLLLSVAILLIMVVARALSA